MVDGPSKYTTTTSTATFLFSILFGFRHPNGLTNHNLLGLLEFNFMRTSPRAALSLRKNTKLLYVR